MEQKTQQVQTSAPGGTDLELKTLERPDISEQAVGGEPTMEEMMAQLEALISGGGNSALDQANSARAGNLQSGRVDLSDMLGGCVC